MASRLDTLSDLTSCFGARPGEDRVLIDRELLEEWFHELAAESDRMAIEAIGPSTEGREMWLVAISSPDTIRGLDRARVARSALADGSLLADAANMDGTLAGTKPVVLITAGIHATEIGGVQLMPELLADLVTSTDDRVRAVLDRLIVLIVPTLNPDGMDLVHDWYRQTLGTPSEGTTPPALYHRYAGHDNNRDWYTHALAETRNVIERVHRVWRPNVLLDLHQMGVDAPRYVLPPYIDPVEPHVHPIITSLTTSTGAMLTTAHHRRGHAGVANGVMFDSYSPTRSYLTYHGGVRILAEAASAKIASPATVEASQMSARRGFDARTAGVHNPIPWSGGTWRLRDIMDYHLVTIHALLDEVAANASRWTRDMWAILGDEVGEVEWPIYAIAPLQHQRDPRAAKDLVGVLLRGDVALEVVEEPGQAVPKRTLIVRTRQPFGAYARALMDLTPYPDMPTTPYDVTSHCLPIHMGVEARTLETPEVVDTRPLEDADLDVFPRPSAADAGRGHWLAVDHRSYMAIKVVAETRRNGAEVRRLMRPHFDGGRLMGPGTWLIAGDHALDGMSRASNETVRSWLVRPVPQGTVEHRLPRAGLYIPWLDDAIDAGWLRLMLEQLSLPYSVIRDADLRGGDLEEVDVVLFADQDQETFLSGNTATDYPAPYAGGPGEAGIAQLRRWIEAGGTCIAIDGAARALAEPMDLPLRFPLAGLKAESFASPGAVVRIEPDQAHPLMLGIDEPFPAMLQGNHPFAARTPADGSILAARFARDAPLLSGWIRGQELLGGRGAIADIEMGAGRVVAFAFRPHFRTQMLASYQPLINAIMRAGTAER